jgi:AraC-like DNA-binding protein
LISAIGDTRAPDALVAEAVRRITGSRGACDIAALARDFCLSTRQFERRFQISVGLPPKRFAQIQRFNQVFRILEDPSRNWVDTALDCGYYDQAHLIRDCQRFTGTTPARLTADDGDLARHFYQASHSSNTARRQ